MHRRGKKKVGPNDPCPCGSGRKFKKCCQLKEAEARASRVVVSKTPEAKKYFDLMGRLTAWIHSLENSVWVKEAADWFYDEVHVVDGWERQWIEQVFNVWLLHDYMDDFRGTAALMFLEDVGHRLGHADRRILSRLHDQIVGKEPGETFRFVEVTHVRLDQGLTLKDLLTGEVIDVRERSATHEVTKWDTLLVRVVRFSDHNEMATAAPVPRTQREFFLEGMHELLEWYRKAEPDMGPAGLFRHETPRVFALCVEAHRHARRLPQVRTTDGEQLVFCRAHYDVSDRNAVEQAMDAHRSFETWENCYAWLSGTRRRGPMAGRRVTLGRVDFEGNRLVLETHSRPRLKKGKQLLEKICGQHLRHTVDEIEDMEQMIQRARDQKPVRCRSEISEEVQREIVGKFMEDHYRRWVDEPLPALEGKTPRQAAKNRRLRPKLVELLKDFENMSSRSNRPGPDVAELRKRLGINEDE